MSSDECRAELFRDRGQEVLGSVVQATQMSQPDPFDVEQIHTEAREAFEATLQQVRKGPVSRILLIRGEAGCGKTHLIRSLRAQVHASRTGVIAYVHMTAEQTDYRQYLLRQVIKSLLDRYDTTGASPEASALDLISDGIVERGNLAPEAADALRDADDETLAELVTEYADRMIDAENPDGSQRFADVDLNTLRILLYRQSTQKPIRRRVNSFLNGEPLSDLDWKKLAAMPMNGDRSAVYLLTQLARVTHAAMGVPLIICVDQIENSDLTGKNHDPFIRAMSTACELIELVPGMMVLLSCLDNAYNVHAPHLLQSARHRIENDPRPALLTAARSAGEIRQILSRRLKWLYESEGLEHIPANSVYPMPEEVPDRLQRQPVRVVLQLAKNYWELFHSSPVNTTPPWVDGPAISEAPIEKEADVDRLRIKWNEFVTAGGNSVSEDDDIQFALLIWALGEIPQELDPRTVVKIEAQVPGKGFAPVPCLSISVQEPRTARQSRLVGLCDKDPRGGGLDRQIQAMESLNASKPQRMVVLRTTPFPKSGKVMLHLKKLEAAGHLRAVVEDQTWQTMRAMQRFLPTLTGYPQQVIQDWRRTEQPLVRLPGISTILQIEKPEPVIPDNRPPTTPATPATVAAKSAATHPPEQRLKKAAQVASAGNPKAGSPAPTVISNAPLIIGKTDGLGSGDVSIDPQSLTRHTAIFGANGSGENGARADHHRTSAGARNPRHSL